MCALWQDMLFDENRQVIPVVYWSNN